MDPITLLATANACVAAVKKGVQLYKDIRGAAGEVKDVLADLKKQYEALVHPTPQQKQQYHEEVQRVQAIGKADPNDAFTQIGDQLGALMDAYDARQSVNRRGNRGEEGLQRRGKYRPSGTAQDHHQRAA